MSSAPVNLPEEPLEDREEGAFRPPTIFDWASFVLVAAARRKAVAALVFAAGMAATTVFFNIRTPMYRVEARLLAQGLQALPFLAQRPGANDDPTRSARELIYRRENLLNLIKQAKIPVPTKAEASGEPTLWLKIRRGAEDEEAENQDDPLNLLVERLRKKLLVLPEEGAVTLSLDWPDREQAYQLVEAAQQNFLEARHVQEITALADVISLLRVRVSALREQLEQTEAAKSSIPSVSRVRTDSAPDDDLLKLKSDLEGKERAIQDLDDMRRRRLAELQAQLDQMRGVYAADFPAVVTLRQQIASLSNESPQLQELKSEEAELRKQYLARLGGKRAQAAAAARPVSGTGDVSRDEHVDRVKDARLQYQQMLDRLEAAEVDFDTARAAFKHRYKVVWPAQMPKDPVSPNPVKIFGAGFLGSLFLALFLAALPALRRGVVLQRWQVERALRLPVLAVLKLRS